LQASISGKGSLKRRAAWDSPRHSATPICVRPGAGQGSVRVTQSDLADALGITDVHINRILQTFRTSGILDIKRKQVTLRDLERVVEIGGFDDRYLHP
jgi:CRP-like cAMP-binding protein